MKDAAGEVVELRCSYDPATRGGSAPDGRKPKATLHWISAAHAIDIEARLYDRLFSLPDLAAVEEGKDWKDYVNPGSAEILTGCKAEAMLAGAKPGERVQFERVGYFCVDPDSTSAHPVFNRTVTLKDAWAKIEQQQRTTARG